MPCKPCYCLANHELTADSEPSVKNGAELLDRLMKDIVSEKASTYVSVVQSSPIGDGSGVPESHEETCSDDQALKAFSLDRFVPLLKERLPVINAFTRSFLVTWITILNSIPDLDFIVHLPAIIGHLLEFLADPHQDVKTATSRLLDSFLDDITTCVTKNTNDVLTEDDELPLSNLEMLHVRAKPYHGDGAVMRIDFSKLVAILVESLHAHNPELQTVIMRWLYCIYDLFPDGLAVYIPALLGAILPTMAHVAGPTQEIAHNLNKLLLGHIQGCYRWKSSSKNMSLIDDISTEFDLSATTNVTIAQL